MSRTGNAVGGALAAIFWVVVAVLGLAICFTGVGAIIGLGMISVSLGGLSRAFDQMSVASTTSAARSVIASSPAANANDRVWKEWAKWTDAVAGPDGVYLVHRTDEEIDRVASWHADDRIRAKARDTLESRRNTHSLLAAPEPGTSRQGRHAQEVVVRAGGIEYLSHLTDGDLSTVAEHHPEPRLRDEAYMEVMLRGRRRIASAASSISSVQTQVVQQHATASSPLYVSDVVNGNRRRYAWIHFSREGDCAFIEGSDEDGRLSATRRAVVRFRPGGRDEVVSRINGLILQQTTHYWFGRAHHSGEDMSKHRHGSCGCERAWPDGALDGRSLGEVVFEVWNRVCRSDYETEMFYREQTERERREHDDLMDSIFGGEDDWE